MSAADSAAAKGIALQERDLAVLEGLFVSRIMQRDHLAAIYFDGRDEAAKRRVQMLRGAGYIGEQNPTRAPNEKAIYRLMRRGFEALKQHGRLSSYEQMSGRRFVWKSLDDRHQVSPLTVKHELTVMDVKASTIAAARQEAGLSVAEFSTWPSLYDFDAAGRTMKPDGFMRFERIVDGRRMSRFCFLEVDRGTENHRTLVEKIEGYQGYNKSPAFAQFLTGSAHGALSFRVLVVFTTGATRSASAEERMFNHAHWLCRLSPPVRTFVWLTTHTEIVSKPLAEIWLCPEDYGQALAGTPYDPASGEWTPRFRETPRDALVRERAVKRALLKRGPSR